jgi:hypothetical protein
MQPKPVAAKMTTKQKMEGMRRDLADIGRVIDDLKTISNQDGK